MTDGAVPPLVLLVEDSLDLREVLEETLVQAGYLVAAVANADAALEVVRRQTVDVVVTDIFLGNTSGLDLITRIRSDIPSPPPIIACSGMPDVRGAALARGAEVFLVKPLDAETLEQAIAALVSHCVPSPAIIEEGTKRSTALRTRQIEAARKAWRLLEPQRPLIERIAARDCRWLPEFFGFGHAIVTIVDDDAPRILGSSDPDRWVPGANAEHALSVCRHVLETGSTFVVPDLGLLVPASGAQASALRFVACFPFSRGDVPIGALCVVDSEPRRLDPADFGLLEDLCRVVSDVMSGETVLSRVEPLMGRRAFEAILRSEFSRAARDRLTVHVLVCSSSEPPPDIVAYRTIVASLDHERFALLITRDADERAPADLLQGVRRLADAPGFRRGELFSVDPSAVPRLDSDVVLRMVERRVEERAARSGLSRIRRVVLHEEPLEGFDIARAG